MPGQAICTTQAKKTLVQNPMVTRLGHATCAISGAQCVAGRRVGKPMTVYGTGAQINLASGYLKLLLEGLVPQSRPL